MESFRIYLPITNYLNKEGECDWLEDDKVFIKTSSGNYVEVTIRKILLKRIIQKQGVGGGFGLGSGENHK